MNDDSETAETDQQQCAHCESPIEGDPVHGQGDVTEQGARRLTAGRTVAGSDLFAFNDGPYCSLRCAIATSDNDGETA